MKITEADYKRVATLLKVETAVVKAVAEVESGGRGGFLPDGRVVILFEGHIFWQQLQQRGIKPEAYTAGNESVLYPSWTRQYYRGGAAEYERLDQAIHIHKEAALSSASWGMFQIMGFNAGLCGYPSVEAFVKDMSRSETIQLRAFARFILSRHLAEHLRHFDWPAFARAYNGPAYARNRYSTRLAAAYRKYKEIH